MQIDKLDAIIVTVNCEFIHLQNIHIFAEKMAGIDYDTRMCKHKTILIN